MQFVIEPTTEMALDVLDVIREHQRRLAEATRVAGRPTSANVLKFVPTTERRVVCGPPVILAFSR